MANSSASKEDIRKWWADFPMTYGVEHGDTEFRGREGSKVEIGSREFFENADATFYRWNRPLHTSQGKFSRIFPYQEMKGKRILEVGCGMGCMAMNWAMQGARVTAVDLNPVAVEQTRRRFEVFGLEGEILEADGEELPFPDDTFDYVYSWGVLHHSPNTQKSVAHLFRVLAPGGKVGVMLYHRDSFLYKYRVQYVEGFCHLENQFLDELSLSSRYGDGGRQEGNPHTWPVTREEVHSELFAQYANVQTRILGTDIGNALDHLFPKMGSILMPKPILKALARRWGWSVWITGEKPG